MELTVDNLLRQCTGVGASDLHIQVGREPLMRLDGSLMNVPGHPVLSEDDVTKMFNAITDSSQKKDYYENRSIDFSHHVPGVARFRVNLFLQQQKQGGVFRRIPEKIPNIAELAAPVALLDFARAPRGLVLVTGPTGSGKSTTLAAVLDVINAERHDHILTIEDPIEFVHSPKRCLINQREVGRDTPNFNKALKDALREDPDVILVGEMRDYETISIALTAAETGHLVFGTLHTSSAPSSIDRIIDAFPADQQQQVRVMLAGSLVGIVTQTLLPRQDGRGRIAAHEVLVVNNPVRAHIRKQDTAQIRSVLQTHTQIGMQTLDRALVYLVSQGVVSEDTARSKSESLEEFEQLLKRLYRGEGVTPPKLIQPGQVGQQMQPDQAPEQKTAAPPQPPSQAPMTVPSPQPMPDGGPTPPQPPAAPPQPQAAPPQPPTAGSGNDAPSF